MIENNAPLLVASYGNTMAGDDAFGQRVADRVQAMQLPNVAVLKVGMQPFGLVHQLNETCPGLVIVDASQATEEIPAGQLLDFDFFDNHQLRLLHDLVLSTHGLSVANELELARRLHTLPSRVRLVTATVASIDVGQTLTSAIEGLIEPAANRVAQILMEWHATKSGCQYA